MRLPAHARYRACRPASASRARAGAATPATFQPGDEVVTEPPAQKIPNKQAMFSGLDKITGRIINRSTWTWARPCSSARCG